MSIKHRLLRTGSLIVIGLGIGMGVGLYLGAFQDGQVVKRGTEQPSPAVAGADIGGPFTLINQDGEKVTEKDFGESYKLIYFGFTYCPAICPTELQKITRALKKLEHDAPALAEKIQPVFISVDPERDTPGVMKDYISAFHPRMTGLTGTQPQIDQVKRAYRIFSAKVETEELNDYTVDHSSFIYLMSPQNKPLAIYRIDDTAQYMAADMKKLLVNS